MKKNKKTLPEIPEIKVSDVCEKGSVGEFIELLKHFPANAKFTLNGTADIDAEEIGGLESGASAATIYPRENVCDECCDCCDDVESERCITDESAYEDTHADIIMRNHLSGIARDNHNFLNGMRDAFTDKLIESPVMNPTKDQLAYEEEMLHPYQSRLLDEMREHNNYVSEAMAELYRRQLSAILEYNTQCIAHFGLASNRSMCEIIGAIEEDN